MIKFTYRFFVVFFIALSIISCKNKLHNKQEHNVVGLEKNDATFLALKDTAQHHLSEFTASLALHGLDTAYVFLIKSDFSENGVHEHMWSRIVRYQQNTFAGVFIDSAFVVKNIKPGDNVQIPQGDVEDWTITDQKHHQKSGGFSIGYLKKQRSYLSQ